MSGLWDLEVRELVMRIRVLEHENACLRRALVGAICGNVMNPSTSCQLARGHDGLHCWRAPGDELVLVRWG